MRRDEQDARRRRQYQRFDAVHSVQRALEQSPGAKRQQRADADADRRRAEECQDSQSSVSGLVGVLVLLVLQASLVAFGRTPLHRQLGSGGGVLVAAMTMAIPMSRVPLATVIVFPALVGGALWWRRFPETHKRLLLLATIELLPAGFGRWPILATAGRLGFLDIPICSWWRWRSTTVPRPAACIGSRSGVVCP